MDLFSGQYLQNIVQELQGPGRFRFIVQPTIALLLGIRDGKLDARAGKPPYLFHLLTDPKSRPELWREGVSAIGKPFFLAWLLDTAVQVLVLGRWNPFQAVVVAAFLIALPYASARGLANRN